MPTHPRVRCRRRRRRGGARLPEIWWCLVVFALVGAASELIDRAGAECLYEGRQYQEGTEVATLEPCLNCTCAKGALLCYLRVCPGLPNPPPPGCILLHRYKTCCPELICTEFPVVSNEIEARSEPDDGFEIDRSGLRNACISNGTIYGPGSAMGSSSHCEYCYCLGGQQRCVKPRCLLPIEGCAPIYESHSCCPVHYNCTRPKITTTTVSPQATGGCLVSGQFYPEGGKVLGVGHSVCDNCYCLRGLLRCEPLSCAPPLLGCAPVIKPGECCAASYNCSGNIAIDPEPNYGEAPVISKEYAKLRKEFQQMKLTTATSRETSATPFYVIAESSGSTSSQKVHRLPGNYGTTRHFNGLTSQSSTKNPYYYETYNDTKSDKTISDIYYATTNHHKRPYSPTHLPKPEETTQSVRHRNKGYENRRVPDYEEVGETSILKLMNSLLETHLRNEESGPTESSWSIDLLDSLFSESLNENQSVAHETTTPPPEENRTPSTITTEDVTEPSTISTVLFETTFETNATSQEQTTTEASEADASEPVTFKNVLNTTDCTENEINDVEHRHHVAEVSTVDAEEINKLEEVTNVEPASTEDTASTQHDVTEVDLEYKVDVAKATQKPSPKIELLQNLTKTKDETLDYDYNDLPPSLPNLRIIPFVAADALDTKKQTPLSHPVYPLVAERITESPIYSYTNLFSPPVETEGGFVPKNPPILDAFYENAYLTTPPDVNAVTPPSAGVENAESNCISSGQKVRHGQTVPSNTPCVTCVCLYGTIVCHQVECPPLQPGCKITNLVEHTCCSQYICPEDTMLDRLDATIPEVSIASDLPTPDPFKDVIKTEPAPDLQSLISDMIPFFAQKTTPGVTTTSTTAPASFGTLFDRIFELFPEENNRTQIQTHVADGTADGVATEAPPGGASRAPSGGRKPQRENAVDNGGAALGLLKLAGCNIYGRMYRVGRIISELSGPCMECKCTEVGVQCTELRC